MVLINGNVLGICVRVVFFEIVLIMFFFCGVLIFFLFFWIVFLFLGFLIMGLLDFLGILSVV